MPLRTEATSAPVPAAINIMDVITGVGRRKLLILGTTVLAFGIGMGVVSTLKPVYTSEAQVLIQNLETPFDRVQPLESQRGDTIDDRVVASQISVIKSEDLARRVIAALGLENNAEFNALLNGQGSLSKMKIKLGFGSDPARKTPEQRALDRYGDKLNVFQLPESNVVGIQYTSNDPETAAKIANTLADIYVMWTREAQSQPTERARDWLSAQIDGLRKKLAASEEAVERFRSQAGLLKGATATLGEQEISELNSQISVAKGASLEARAKADAIRSILQTSGSVDSATDVLNSATVQRLKEQRTDATRRRAELAVTYLSNHPKMVAVQNEISNIDRQIRAEALKVVKSLDEQARIAESREQSLVASLEGLKGQESAANLDDVKLKALERDASADRVLLEAMLSRYAEASARQDRASQPGLAVVIQNASAPATPSFPKTGPMVLLITIAGFAFGLGLAFLLELMAAAMRLGDVAVAEPKSAELSQSQPATPSVVFAPASVPPPIVNMPPPVVAPAAKEPAAPVNFPAPAAPMSPPPDLAAANYLTAWSRIVPQTDVATLMQAPDLQNAAQVMAGWARDVRQTLNVICVGIATLGTGSSDAPIAAMAIARVAAETGKRVVLLDLARTASLIGGLAGVPAGPGLTDLISGTAAFTKVIARDTGSPAHILRYGMNHTPAATALINERLGSVLAALSQSYDLVLVNMGELNGDSLAYMQKCQAALLMTPPERQDDGAAVLELLTDAGLLATRQVLISQPPAQSFSPTAQAVNA